MGHSDDESDKEEEWAEKLKRRKSQLHHSWKESEHPGCEISGHLLVDRVPVSETEMQYRRSLFFCVQSQSYTSPQGNFHIQARSPHHDLVPHMTK